MHLRERGIRGRALRTSTSYPEKPVVQPRWFGTRWLSPLEPYPFGGPGNHSRHFQIRLRHYYRRSSSAAESSSPEAPAHPPMQRSTYLSYQTSHICKSPGLKRSNGAFPLHGTARYGTVWFTFGGFSTGYCTWYLILF